METLKIEIGKVSDHLYSLMTQTKARKIRAGLSKKMEAIEKVPQKTET